LTRQSITQKTHLSKKMDARIKSGHDTLVPINTSLILFGKMAAFAAAVSRGFAADVVISGVL
jgi:hypothetical protein